MNLTTIFCFVFRIRAVQKREAMKLGFIIFTLIVQWRQVRAQDNFMQYLMEQTNFLIYNSSYIIDDTINYLPSYDFIIIGSGSGG